jgi:hypothetical protein
MLRIQIMVPVVISLNIQADSCILMSSLQLWTLRIMELQVCTVCRCLYERIVGTNWRGGVTDFKVLSDFRMWIEERQGITRRAITDWACVREVLCSNPGRRQPLLTWSLISSAPADEICNWSRPPSPISSPYLPQKFYLICPTWHPQELVDTSTLTTRRASSGTFISFHSLTHGAEPFFGSPTRSS